jgi:hypothetical protein
MRRMQGLTYRRIATACALLLAIGACSPSQSIVPTATAPATASASAGASPSASIAAPTMAPGSYVILGRLGASHSGGVIEALADGRVLLAGGQEYSQGPVMESCELYDPVLRQFYPGAPMAIPAAFALSTRLSDGRVLIVGGFGDPQAAQLFDPKSSTFALTGSPQWQVDYSMRAASLNNGNAIIIGGPPGDYSNGRRAQLYDAASGTFRPTGSMVARRDLFFTATTLADGRVLVTGGMVRHEEYGEVLRTAEIYDPATGKFTATGSMGVPRSSHVATLLSDGRVLIFGGTDDVADLGSAEVFDPKDGRFHPVSPMVIERPSGALVLADGRLIIFGGGESEVAMYLSDPDIGSSQALGSVPYGPGLIAPVLVPGGQLLFPGNPSILFQP